jgi:hypothetical protein
MMNKRSNSENGQAIVLLVLSLVVLLGFTALAIDGGMVYSDRRHAQNGADTASLAGAGAAASVLQEGRITYMSWNCPNVLYAVTARAEDAAIFRAASNSYNINSNPSDSDDGFVALECGDIPLGPYNDRYIDVMTEIEKNTPTSFAHLLYNGELRNRVEAVARVRPRSPVGLGNAVVALNQSACQGNQNGLQFVGTSVTTITGGGALTLGCLDVDGVGNQSSVINTDQRLYYDGEWDGNYADKFQPAPPSSTTSPSSPEIFTIDPPSCSGLTSRTLPTGNPSTVSLEEGRYSETVSITNGQTFTLQPGLYCFENSPNAFTMNGGTLIGHGVTLFAPNGDINITGGTITLSAPCTDLDPSQNICDTTPSYPEHALRGTLIYTYHDVTFVGNGDSTMLGTIYAPSGTVTVSGTSDISPTLNTQIIAHNVEIGGSGRLIINFTEGNNAMRGARMDMHR